MYEVLVALAASVFFTLLTIPLWPFFGAAALMWRLKGEDQPFLQM